MVVPRKPGAGVTVIWPSAPVTRATPSGPVVVIVNSVGGGRSAISNGANVPSVVSSVSVDTPSAGTTTSSGAAVGKGAGGIWSAPSAGSEPGIVSVVTSTSCGALPSSGAESGSGTSRGGLLPGPPPGPTMAQSNWLSHTAQAPAARSAGTDSVLPDWSRITARS